MSTFFHGLPNNIPFDPVDIEMSQQYSGYKRKVLAALIGIIQDSAEMSDLRYQTFVVASDNQYYNRQFLTWLQFTCDLFELILVTDDRIDEHTALKNAVAASATYCCIDVYKQYPDIQITDQVYNGLVEASDCRARDIADIRKYVFNQQPQQQMPMRQSGMTRSYPQQQQSTRTSGMMPQRSSTPSRLTQQPESRRMSDLITDEARAQVTRPTRIAPVAVKPVDVTVTNIPVAKRIEPLGELVQVTKDNVFDLVDGIPFIYDATLFTLMANTVKDGLKQKLIKRSDDVEYEKHEYDHLLNRRSVVIEPLARDKASDNDAHQIAIMQLMTTFGERMGLLTLDTFTSDVKELLLYLIPETTLSPTGSVLESFREKLVDVDLPYLTHAISFVNVHENLYTFEADENEFADALLATTDLESIRTILVNNTQVFGIYSWGKIEQKITDVVNRVLASVAVEPYSINSFVDDIVQLLCILEADESVDFAVLSKFMFREVQRCCLHSDYKNTLPNTNLLDLDARHLLSIERILLLPIIAHQVNLASSGAMARLTAESAPGLHNLVKLLFATQVTVPRITFQTIDAVQFYVYHSPYPDEYVVTTKANW